MASYKGQLYSNSKRESKLTNKVVISAILTLHYGSKLTNEESIFTLSLSRMTPLLVNFDPLLKLVYSWLLIFKCVWPRAMQYEDYYIVAKLVVHLQEVYLKKNDSNL